VGAKVVEVEGGAVAGGGGRQRSAAHQGRGGRVQVDGIGEANDEVGERDVQAVAGEVTVVGERVHHGARAAAWFGCQPSGVLRQRLNGLWAHTVVRARSLPGIGGARVSQSLGSEGDGQEGGGAELHSSDWRVRRTARWVKMATNE
jgi:hypothetical protein